MSPSLLVTHLCFQTSWFTHFTRKAALHDSQCAVPLAFVETLSKSVFPYFSIFTPAFFNALKV